MDLKEKKKKKKTHTHTHTLNMSNQFFIFQKTSQDSLVNIH